MQLKAEVWSNRWRCLDPLHGGQAKPVFESDTSDTSALIWARMDLFEGQKFRVLNGIG